MAWLIGIAIIVLLVFVQKKRSGNTALSIRQQTRSAQERTKFLSDSEKDEFSAEVRELALEQYDMASAKAKELGKDGAFAHQIGVLRAVSAVIVQGAPVDPYRERELQMETVPFNKLLPTEGRKAIAEYLVYKFFPDRADESLFSNALASFKRSILADAEEQEDLDGFMFQMLYCVKYDWQRYIVAMSVNKNHEH